MKFYHYTYDTRWEIMQYIGVLQANNGYGRTMPHPKESNTLKEMPAIWGLHEPVPNEWHGHLLWNLLINHFCNAPQLDKAGYPGSLVLLECDIPTNGDTWVADWGGFESRLNDPDENAMGYYKNSMIHYSHFNANNHMMEAPELVCFEDIPTTNVQSVIEIPIDQGLESVRLFIRNTTGLWHGKPNPKKGPNPR
jgi:hypothetical protein